MQTLFIIGAMKCATTSLFEWLAYHPQICPSRVKEPEYFSFPQGTKTLPKYEPSRLQANSFEELFDLNPRIHQVVMEASTGYSKYPAKTQVPERIQETMAGLGWEPKFIYLVRDPYKRIESQFNHMYGLGHERQDADLCAENYVGLSRYALQLRQYVQVFGKQPILVITLEELKQSPKQVLRKCHRFLGLDILIWRPLSGFPRRFNQHNRGTDYRPLSTVPRKLTVQERENIHDKLWEDMKELYQEFSVPVSAWGFDVQKTVDASIPTVSSPVL